MFTSLPRRQGDYHLMKILPPLQRGGAAGRFLPAFFMSMKALMDSGASRGIGRLLGRGIKKLQGGLSRTTRKHSRNRVKIIRRKADAEQDAIDQLMERAEMEMEDELGEEVYWDEEGRMKVGGKKSGKTFPSFREYLRHAYKQKQDAITRRRNVRLSHRQRNWNLGIVDIRRALRNHVLHLEKQRRNVSKFKRRKKLPKGRLFGTGRVIV